MTAVVAWFEALLSNIPLPMLEVWGREVARPAAVPAAPMTAPEEVPYAVGI